MADSSEPNRDDPASNQEASSSSQQPPAALKAPAAASASSSTSAVKDDTSPQSHTLLWSKSKVYVHPSPYAKHNVPGYLALSRAGPSRPGAKILLSFLPESLVEQRQELEKFVRIEYTTSAKAGDDTQSEPRKSLDTVEDDDDPDSMLIAEPPTSSIYAFSLPITSIYSFTIKKPTISSWYGTVTISQVGGVAMPTLHFHDDESKSTVLSMHRAKQSASADAAAAASAAAQSHTEDASKLSALPSSSSWSATSSHRASPRPTSPSPTWGGDELVQQLRKYANVHRSAIEPNLFLVNPSRADLETHSTPLFDDDAIDMPNPNPANAAWSHDLSENAYSMSPLHQSLPGGGTPGRRNNELAMDNLTVWAKSARMSVLSSFANFTQQARHASHAVLSHPLARPYVPHLPGPVQSFAQAGPVPLGPNEGEWEWRTSRIANNSGTGEYYDSARVYLARWARLVAEEGERNRRKEERLGANMGDTTDASSSNLHRPSSSGGVRTEGSELGAFEVLEKIYDLPRPTSEREARFAELKLDADMPTSSVGLDVEEWRSLFDADTGRPLHAVSEIRHRIFVNGLTDRARKLAWPYLLDATPFNASSEERAAAWEQREVEYHLYKARWQTDETLLASDEFREQQHRVRVDCLRTDRTQPLFARDAAFTANADADPMQDPNPHTLRLGEILLTYGVWEAEHASRDQGEGLLAGYVQGMSDLCSPLYIMCEGDEVATFWCFVGLMERTKSNFYRDQSGMKTQLLLLQKLINIMDPVLYAHLERTDSLNLFFCFRWLLVRFKREFTFDETLALWESCWAAEPSREDEGGWALSRSFHLFCALALLELHRDYLVRYLAHFDEILQYFNSLTGDFNANTVLYKAEILARSFREIALHKTHPPAQNKNTQENINEAAEKQRDFLDILTPDELNMLL